MESREFANSYLTAVMNRDYRRVASLLSHAVVLRDLSPPGFTEVTGADEVLSFLSAFLDSFDSVDLVDSEVYDVGPVTYVRARVRFVHRDDGTSELEQHHLVAVSDGHIDRIDELCTGRFVP